MKGIEQIGPRPARPWRIVVGSLMVLIWVGSLTVRHPSLAPGDTAGFYGSIFGVVLTAVVLLAGGISMIRSGLPKKGGHHATR